MLAQDAADPKKPLNVPAFARQNPHEGSSIGYNVQGSSTRQSFPVMSSGMAPTGY